jgi:hypothetical protein
MLIGSLLTKSNLEADLGGAVGLDGPGPRAAFDGILAYSAARRAGPASHVAVLRLFYWKYVSQSAEIWLESSRFSA